jgi:hypothetical protein
MDAIVQTGIGEVAKPDRIGPWAENKSGPRQRQNYISMRLAEIMIRIRDFAAERERLTTNLKARQDEKSDEVRKLRLRREYVATRIAQLREEQSALNVEKKVHAQTMGPPSTAGRPGRPRHATAPAPSPKRASEAA